MGCVLATIAAATPPPDAGLFNGYVLSNGYRSVTLFVCGIRSRNLRSSTARESWVRSGTWVRWSRAGRRHSGKSSHSQHLRRGCGGGGSGTDALLYRYALTNTVQPPNDAVTYKLSKKITLPLTGGTNVRCSLASNACFLFVGTDKSTSVVRVAKNGLTLASFAGISYNPTVSAITADANGFVMVAFGGNAAGPAGASSSVLLGTSSVTAAACGSPCPRIKVYRQRIGPPTKAASTRGQYVINRSCTDRAKPSILLRPRLEARSV